MKETINTLPTRKDERWKYTDLSKLLEPIPFQMIDYALRKTDDASIDAHISKSANRIVFIDGLLSESHSQYDNAITLITNHPNEPSVDYNVHPMVKFVDKAKLKTIEISIEQSLGQPLNIFYFFTNQVNYRWVQSHLIIAVKKGVHVKINEKSFLIQPDAFAVSNTLINLKLADASSVIYSNEQTSTNAQLSNIHNLQVEQLSQSNFTYNHMTTAGKLLRNDLHIYLRGEGASCNLLGVAFLTDTSHIDHHVIVEHMASYTSSDVNFRAIAADNAVFVCNPKAVVHSNVNGINAKQSSNNILLNSRASINTKPELEIYSDDVQCTHGATVGQLDEQIIFYMKSRGISESTAKKIIIEAFLTVVLDEFLNEEKEQHKALIAQKIASYYQIALGKV